MKDPFNRPPENLEPPTPPLLRQHNDRCTWEQDSKGHWKTLCAEDLPAADLLSLRTNIRHCCHCGKPLEILPFDPCNAW